MWQFGQSDNTVFYTIYHWKICLYEVDDAFLAPLHEVGVDFVGFSADGNYPEVFEIPAHPFYIGTIYHPEFLSRPNKAHPLFAAFIGAAAAHQA